MRGQRKIMTLNELLNEMIKNRRLRLHIVKRIHKLFFYFYFKSYIEHEIAPFQEEMFQLSHEETQTLVIAAFRGSGKSSIFSLSYPLWAILGEKRLKYVLIISKTQQKAQILLQQIKDELEKNKQLKEDLGPFQEERNGWNMMSLYIKRYDAKIAIASTEQSIRSFRHGNFRPQLIVCDDLEDLDSVKTQESRDRLHNWLVSDVIPAGSPKTQLVILGTILLEDALIRRFIKGIDEGKINGTYRIYPVVDKDGRSLWPGKFPNAEALAKERARGITDSAWHTEYLLQQVKDEHQLVYPEWLERYDTFPPQNCFRYSLIAVDPGISESEDASRTAVLGAKIFFVDGKLKMYILPNPVNETIQFPKIIQRIKELALVLRRDGPVHIAVEGVGAQLYISQQLDSEKYKVTGMNMAGQGDKRERLAFTTPMIFDKTILFPQAGCETLELQMIRFGLERYKDLMDAFSLAVRYMVKHKPLKEHGMYGLMREEYEKFTKNPAAGILSVGKIIYEQKKWDFPTT